MEPIHAELLRLARELEAVKGQVQTECNALRDLFARTSTAMPSSGSQHDWRLNHGEAGRHLPQQFVGSRLDYGDFAFRMEDYAAVLSRDGQGGALLREGVKLEKFEDNTIEILERSFWDVQQLSAAMLGALITCTRGEVATLETDFKLGTQSRNASSPDQWWNRLRRWRGSYRQSAPRT